MMLLSRFWYAILAVVAALALYVVFIAVGQYNRRNSVAMGEGVAADGQVVRWALQIDARRRLDALLVGSVDKGVQDALVGADGKDKVPQASKDGAKKALDGISQKIPPEYRPDALFAVDRDGRVIAESGFDQVNGLEDFELGGYPAVNDALHGYLRDDTWVLGGKIYRVSARPVEYDVTQPPAGAIVGLRVIDPKFAQDMSKLTRTNVAFYAAGTRVASAAGVEGFDDRLLDQVTLAVPQVEADKAYQDTGHSALRTLEGDQIGAMYTRFDGDAWLQRAGFAVARQRVAINGPLGFLSGADDKDKQSVSWPLLVAVVVLGLGLGVLFTFLEHSMPMRELRLQADRLKRGDIDLLQLARFRGGYRPIAQDLNTGIERVAEKGGGAPRKQADLESILGPVPAQPSMSAFSFPNAGGDSAPSAPEPSGPKPFVPPASALGNDLKRPPPPTNPKGVILATADGAPPPRFPGREPASKPVQIIAAPVPGGGQPTSPGIGFAAQRPPSSPDPLQRPATLPTTVGGLSQEALNVLKNTGGDRSISQSDSDSDEATAIARVPEDVLARATGEHEIARQDEETRDWLQVYEAFIRTKKQCGEPTDGLSFEKFQHTLKKNRDALIQRHGCKTVRFSVYVKDGRASLKATPVKD
ncbi:MAG: MXAN_5187 family protein [Polyangiaceae bacterium]